MSNLAGYEKLYYGSDEIKRAYFGDGQFWGDIPLLTAFGGTEYVYGLTKIHKFTGDGDFNVTVGGFVEVLVVAGGGGGGQSGTWLGGGGGAGGYLYEAEHYVSPGTYPITVGTGGGANTKGEDSIFDDMTATGGGKGGSTAGGGDGGSGGGAGATAPVGAGTVGPPRQGYDGGNRLGHANFDACGGGGGAGAVGGDATDGTHVAGIGGDGISTYSDLLIAAQAGVDISGTHWICGGGGGGCYISDQSPHSAGGKGGGGETTVSGTPNTGGGGGGAHWLNIAPGSGGSGIVIIKYPIYAKWIDGWSYRKWVNVTRPGGMVTDYQMKLLVGESAGATGENVDCNGNCATDFDDLRFTKVDGITQLSYWIESITGTTPNQLATVWVKLDTINTYDTTFFMYYGNAGAAAASNADDTFLFFDDFSGDLSKWTGDTGSASISGGILTLAATKTIRSATYCAGDILLFGRVLIHDSNTNTFGLHEPVYGYGLWAQHTNMWLNHSGWGANSAGGGQGQISNSAIGTGSYQNFEFARVMDSNTDTIYAWYNTGAIFNTTYYVTTADLPVMLSAPSGGSSSMDLVYVRKYCPTVPSWGTWSAEESA